MKKTFIIFALLWMMIPAMAQTAPLQKSPQTLAQEMVTNMLQHVTLTADQQTQITTTATTYFSNLRAASQATPETRVALYQSFQESLKTIMTEEIYDQWKNILQQQREQHISNNMSNQ